MESRSERIIAKGRSRDERRKEKREKRGRRTWKGCDTVWEEYKETRGAGEVREQEQR